MFFGHEKIIGLGTKTVKDFWQWSFSDLLFEQNRHEFSQFIIASVLGISEMPRIEWGNCDIRYRKKKISIRTDGYVFSWKQKKTKTLSFDIAPKKGIDAKTDDSITFRNRSAELYIFSVHKEKDLKKIDPLSLDQWEFYVVRTTQLDEHYEKTKKIRVRALRQLASPVHVSRLKTILDDLIDLDLSEKLVL